MQTSFFTPTTPERRDADARYQDALALAEEQYAADLAKLGEHSKAFEVRLRARSHRERAARERRGAR